jgi:hypothetical protein
MNGLLLDNPVLRVSLWLRLLYDLTDFNIIRTKISKLSDEFHFSPHLQLTN